MADSVGIVVPAYRPDVTRLAEYVRALHERLDPDAIRIELDEAGSGVRDALADLRADVASVPTRRGKGAAITAGFEALDTDVLAFADADGSTPADSVARVVARVADAPGVDDEPGDTPERADLAVGSRRHPDAVVTSHQTFARRRLGDAFAWLARRIVEPPLYDYQCGAKAISAATWNAVRSHLYEPGFAWDIELVVMAHALGRRVAEVPIEWHDHPDTTVSTGAATYSLAAGLVTARHRAKLLRDSPLHAVIAAHAEEPVALVDADAGSPR